MKISFSAIITALGTLLLSGCIAHAPDDQAPECVSGDASKACASGFTCLDDHKCHPGCASAKDCGTGMTCSADGQCVAASLPPVITAVDGTGTTDTQTGHGAHHLQGQLIITGQHLANTTVTLTPQTGGQAQTLTPCPPSTDTELHLALPTGLAAGDFTLSLADAAGDVCSADLQVLQGEKGDPGDVATGRIHQTATGEVGIGTTTPSAALTVLGTLAKPITGTVSITAGSTTVTGTGTSFQGELGVGDALRIGTSVYTVTAFAAAVEQLTVDPTPAESLAGAPAYRDGDLLSLQTGAGQESFSVDSAGNVQVNGDLVVGGASGIAIFRKRNNNGSATCDFFCASSAYSGRAGLCLGGGIGYGPNNANVLYKCSEAPGPLSGFAIECFCMGPPLP